jgi:type I restriction enzyme S subunit
MTAERLLAQYERIADAPDAIPCLRRFVLDLAVRGKLVTQEAKDEPAQELLKRIAVEKDRLVRAGQIRDKSSLPIVTDNDAPFHVPVSWSWVRLANIIDFSAGRTPSRNDTTFWNNGDHAWVSIADMAGGQILTTTKETVSDKARERVFGSEPELPGTIIMSFKLTIGKIARLGIPAFHNEAIISIRPHLTDLDAYLFKVLPQFARQGDTKGAIKGATLNRESISNILVPLPPLAEQHRIVAKVDELMALCDRLEAARAEREAARNRLAAASLARLNAPDPDSATFADHARFALNNLAALATRPDQVQQLRQTILNLAVRGKLVPQDPSEEPSHRTLARLAQAGGNTKVRRTVPETIVTPKELQSEALPLGWCLESVAMLLRTGAIRDLKDGNHGANHPKVSDFSDKGLPFITAAQVSDTGTIDYDEAYKLAGPPLAKLRVGFAEDGDVIYTHKGSVGRVALCDRDCVLSPQTTYYRPDTSVISNGMLRVLLLSDLFRDQVDAVKKQTTRDFVSIQKQYEFFLRIPPLAEQHRIVAKVDELMALCDRLEASLAAAQTGKSRLLNAVLYEALAETHDQAA